MKYVNNAISFLCMAFILVACIGSYMGADTFTEISQKFVEALPFGNYIWHGYTLYNDSDYTQETVNLIKQSVLMNIRDLVGEMVKVVITWFVYRICIRNAVSILMMAYCDGSGKLSDIICSEVLYNIGFVIASLLSDYILKYIDGLFLKIGNSVTVILTQIAAYGIVAVGGALVIFFVLSNKIFGEILKALIDGIVRLGLAASFFLFINYLGVNQAVSYQLGIIVVLGIGLTLIIESIGL